MAICVEWESGIRRLRPVAPPSCRLWPTPQLLDAGMEFVVPERLSRQDLTVNHLYLIVVASCLVASSARTFVPTLLAIDLVLLLPLSLGDPVSGVVLVPGLAQRVAVWCKLPHLLMEAMANLTFVVLVEAEGLFEEAFVHHVRARFSRDLCEDPFSSVGWAGHNSQHWQTGTSEEVAQRAQVRRTHGGRHLATALSEVSRVRAMAKRA